MKDKVKIVAIGLFIGLFLIPFLGVFFGRLTGLGELWGFAVGGLIGFILLLWVFMVHLKAKAERGEDDDEE